MKMRFQSRSDNVLSDHAEKTAMIGVRGEGVQPADIEWPTGNGEKLSCSQAQLGQATYLAVA